MPPTLLLAADGPPDALESLLQALRTDGYEASAAAGWDEAWRRFVQEHPSAVLVDLGAGSAGGLALCKKVRSHASLSATPLVALAAGPGLEEKRGAFAAGADLVLARPLEPKRLLLSLKSLLRRAGLAEEQGGVLRAEDFVVDPRRRAVKVGGRAVSDLTPKEFDLLYELVRRRPKTLSKAFIIASLWKAVLRDNTVEVHVLNLRRKLGPAGQRVVTVPKKGYRFV